MSEETGREEPVSQGKKIGFIVLVVAVILMLIQLALYLTTGGEVRSWDQLEELLVTEIRTADQCHQPIHHFPKVVGWNAGGHPHCDA